MRGIGFSEHKLNFPSSAADLETQLKNLILALSVAHIETSVEILESLMREGRPTTDGVLQRLIDELDKNSAMKEKYERELPRALEDELHARFGTHAGDAVSHALSRWGGLREILRSLVRVCAEIYEPLASFVAAQKNSRACQAELVHAIAEKGIETITAFKYVEKVRSTRDAAHEELMRLHKAAGVS